MRISPVGAMVVALGVLAGIIIWVVGYIGLPNQDTHRNLSQNPPVLSSVTQNATSSTSNATATGNTTGGGSSGASSNAAWYSLDKAAKTVDFSITAAATQASSGFNFNGYSNGDLKITVPQGWTVKMTFANKDANIPHSLAVVAYADRTASSLPAVAFPGATTPNPTAGITSSGGQQTFSFKATKAGQYAIICGVPGHDEGGMWDEFDVSASAKAPTVTTPSGTTTVQ